MGWEGEGGEVPAVIGVEDGRVGRGCGWVESVSGKMAEKERKSDKKVIKSGKKEAKM